MTTCQQIDRQEYCKSYIAQGYRRDGRGFGESRPTVVNVKSLRHAEGSAIVRLGDTTVVCGIKAELAKPKAETPSEGFLVVNVELPPLCSPQILPGPPSDEAQAATTLLTRALLSTQAVQLHTLCLVPDQLAWVLYVDIVCLNLDGGLLAAAFCSATAALKNTTLPSVKLDVETGVKTVQVHNRVPLSIHATPFATTFALFEDGLVEDPTEEEESMSTGVLTAIVCPQPNTAFPLYLPGCRPLTSNELSQCMEAARRRALNLAELIDVAEDNPER